MTQADTAVKNYNRKSANSMEFTSFHPSTYTYFMEMGLNGETWKCFQIFTPSLKVCLCLRVWKQDGTFSEMIIIKLGI